MNRARSRRSFVTAGALVVGLIAIACGKKGPPLAPLRPVPARVEDLTIRRLGNDVHLQFTLPAKNADGTTPADLGRVEAVAISGDPALPDGRPLDARDFLKFGARVAAVDVEPPPPPAPEEGPPPPPPPPDPRPAQGERVTLTEVLTPAALVRFEHPLRKRADESLPPVEPAELVSGPLTIPVVDPLSRVYVVTGRSKRDTAGPLSARLRVPLTPPPEAPGAPTVRYEATKFIVEWTAPSSARLPVQPPLPPSPAQPPPVPPPAAPQGAGSVTPASPPLAPLPGRPLFPTAVPHSYNVYEVARVAAGDALAPMPINPKPLESLSLDDPRMTFGVERCYVVRMVEAAANVTVESTPSPMTCVTPRDTFPPAAPRNLAAVGAEGSVSLIWESNAEQDLAGYIVLRGVPGSPLEPLTAGPIRETTYRDAAVTAGVRYVYAVVAVDNASPPNRSAESNRVDEGGR